MFPRLTQTLKRLRRVGISVTHALWQQGEAEGALPNADGSVWVSHFKEMVVTLRQYAISAPIFVAQGTGFGGASGDRIRAAQRAVVTPSAGIFAGPNVDVIGQDERWDGCHFSTAGLEKAAELWFGDVCAHANRYP
jgi:hypothetical protein